MIEATWSRPVSRRLVSSASEQAGQADVFVEVRPVDSESRCVDAKAPPLFHRSTKQYGKLHQRDRERLAVGQFQDERVGFEVKVEDAYVRGL